MGRARRFATLLLAAAVGACGGPGPGDGVHCEPGETRPCACEDRQGAATCEAEGRFGACACPGMISLSPTSIDFGVVGRGVAREATVSIGSDGVVPVPLRRVALSADSDPAFSLVFAPTEVPATGQVAMVGVSFRSDVPREATGSLVLEAEGQAALAVPLRGVVVGPWVTCSPDTVDFGERVLGAAATRQVTCRNSGLGGNDSTGVFRPERVLSDDPELTATFPSGAAIGPGEELVLEVRYLPVDAEPDRANLRLVGGEFEAPFAAAGTSRAEPCDLDVVPVSLTGVPGEDLSGTIAIHNRRGDTGCLLDRVEVRSGCAAGFTFELPAPGTAILAGADLAIPFGFRGDEQIAYACEVGVLADDPEHRAWAAVIDVALSWRPCLALEGVAEFPPISPSCGPSGIEPVLRNRCNGEFLVDGLRFNVADYPSFFPPEGFAVGAELPTTIPPGGGLVLPLRYDPEPDPLAPEVEIVRLEVLSPLGADPWPFEFRAERRPDDIRSRLSFQTHGGPLDVLLVIDNGLGMAAESARIVTDLGPMPARLAGHDFRLAVTTTGLVASTSGTCPGGVSGGEDGRFFPVDGSRPRAIGPYTPYPTAWETNLQVGACHDAPAQPLAAAARALGFTLTNASDDPNHPEPDDGNRGFFRAGSNTPLLLVFIGDRDDASPASVESYWSAIRGTRAFVDPVVIAGNPTSSCTGAGGEAAAAAPRLHAFAGVSGAEELSICTGPWDFLARYDLSDLLDRCFPGQGPSGDWNRDGVVDADDLVVWVAGTPVPRIGEDGLVNWTWDEEAGQVCFPDDGLPPAGVAVSVRHLVCE